MPTYGVTSTGFVAKTLDDIRADTATRLRGYFGSNVPLDANSIFGQLQDSFSFGLAECWEAMEEVYSSDTPSGATGVKLVELSSLTGTKPLPQSKSTLTITAYGTPGTSITAGKQVATHDTGVRFITTEDAVIGGGGTVAIHTEALDYGPMVARAAATWDIITPVSGWTGVTNAVDAVEGRLVETDSQLRLRRQAELSAAGGGSLPAVVADVLKVTDVTEVVGFENITDVIDGDGLPPHSIEVIVSGGDDGAIRAAIFDSKAGGIASNGTTTGVVADVNGIVHTINFSRPGSVSAYIDVDLEVYPGKFPSNGGAIIGGAVADWGDEHLTIGIDVVPSQLVQTIFDAVPGIKAVKRVSAGTSAWPATTDDLAVSLRQKADLDSGRVRVNLTYVTTA
jgi:uncharacterized phage protein gp47/JayE